MQKKKCKKVLQKILGNFAESVRKFWKIFKKTEEKLWEIRQNFKEIF